MRTLLGLKCAVGMNGIGHGCLADSTGVVFNKVFIMAVGSKKIFFTVIEQPSVDYSLLTVLRAILKDFHVLCISTSFWVLAHSKYILIIFCRHFKIIFRQSLVKLEVSLNLS